MTEQGEGVGGTIERSIYTIRNERVMLSSVLHSSRAVAVNVEMMRAFVRLSVCPSANTDQSCGRVPLMESIEAAAEPPR